MPARGFKQSSGGDMEKEGESRQVRIIKLVCVSDRGQRVGESGSSSKLTNADARNIRELAADYGISERALADKFDVSRRTIRNILNGRTYPEIFRVVARRQRSEER